MVREKGAACPGQIICHNDDQVGFFCGKRGTRQKGEPKERGKETKSLHGEWGGLSVQKTEVIYKEGKGDRAPLLLQLLELQPQRVGALHQRNHVRFRERETKGFPVG